MWNGEESFNTAQIMVMVEKYNISRKSQQATTKMKLQQLKSTTKVKCNSKMLGSKRNHN